MKKSICLTGYELKEKAYTAFQELDKGKEYALKIEGVFYRFKNLPEESGVGGAYSIKTSQKNYIRFINSEMGDAILKRSDLVNIRDVRKTDD